MLNASTQEPEMSKKPFHVGFLSKSMYSGNHFQFESDITAEANGIFTETDIDAGIASAVHTAHACKAMLILSESPIEDSY